MGIFSVLLAAVIYFEAGLLAECGLQVFYLLSGFYGWWQWAGTEKSSADAQMKIAVLALRDTIAGVLFALIASSLIYLLLKSIPRAINPLPDALLTGFSLLAQFWLARKKLENWVLWMFINLGSVILYLQRELRFFALLYALLLLLAIRGFVSWKKALSE